MEQQIDRAEHEEFKARIEAENERQNRRLELLEDSVRQNTALTVSVERLAVTMDGMLKEQERQGQRLTALEGKSGKKWEQMWGYIASAGIGAFISFLAGLIIK